MRYVLDCDSCEFSRKVADESRSYAIAKEHESEHGSHFVLIETVANDASNAP